MLHYRIGLYNGEITGAEAMTLSLDAGKAWALLALADTLRSVATEPPVLAMTFADPVPAAYYRAEDQDDSADGGAASDFLFAASDWEPVPAIPAAACAEVENRTVTVGFDPGAADRRAWFEFRALVGDAEVVSFSVAEVEIRAALDLGLEAARGAADAG